MTGSMKHATLLFTVLLLAGSAAPAAAQSIFANRGLGLASEPVDGRGAALGGVSLGLPRGDITWANPADMAGLLAPGLKAVFQLDNTSTDLGTRTESGSTARFPMLLGAFTAGERWVISAGFAGFLDQNWQIRQVDTLAFGGDTVQVTDRLTSEGGVARLRLGATYALSPQLSLALAGDLYTGSTRREFVRFFGESGFPDCCRVEWTYTGVGATAGAAWSPSEALNLSASASFGGTLEARSDTVDVPGGSYSIPASLRMGGSAQVAGNTMVAAAAEWTGWGTLDAPLALVGGAQDAWSLGGGVEWEGTRIRNVPVPLRIGARYATLPFAWGQPGAPTAFPTERALTGGLGFVLAGGAARSDLSFEVGRRGGADAGVTESFNRFVFSISALGR
jgi:hypothetical protein